MLFGTNNDMGKVDTVNDSDEPVELNGSGLLKTDSISSCENILSESKNDPFSGNKPMSGAGLNIKRPSVEGVVPKRFTPIRGIRSVASNVEPLNKLRELSFSNGPEIKLAESLFQKGFITQKQFDEVVERLQKSVKDFGTIVPISALFELQDIESVNMDAIINVLVEDTKVPFISLKSFRISSDVFTKLPPDVAERLGVVLFGIVGRTKQIALLNPANKELKTALCEYLGSNEVSFFLVKPNEISPTYDKLRSQLADL